MASRWFARLPHLCFIMPAAQNPYASQFLGNGPFRIGGAMSGTSLDGLDLVVVELTAQANKDRWRYRILSSQFISYQGLEWAQRLPASYYASASEREAISTDYSRWLNQQFHTFFDGQHIQAIASHGHTSLHQPEQGITIQIGNDPCIAEGFEGIPIVGDFRRADVSRGGQGAPLVPLADAFLYANFAICLNLGGFSNASWSIDGVRRAGDLGPVNLLLNHFAQQLGFSFDRGGYVAKSHRADAKCLRELRELPFYGQSFPKSLGREWVESQVLPLLDPLDQGQALATATEHAAWAILHGLKEAPDGPILVTGGGAQNDYLIDLLRAGSNRLWQIPSAEERDFKEAMCFAFLGLRRLRGEVNVWASVTGASSDGCDGTIFALA